MSETTKLTDEILKNDKFQYLESIEISNNKIENLTNLKYIFQSNLKIKCPENFKKLDFIFDDKIKNSEDFKRLDFKYFEDLELLILTNKNYSFIYIQKQILLIETLCKYYQFNFKLRILFHQILK